MRRFILITMFLGVSKLYSQVLSNDNVIQTAVPFLEINSNGRIGGMGEIGVVSSPFYQDAGLFQNPALLSRGQKYAGICFSHMPWLKNISNDTYFTNLSGFFALDTLNSFGYNFTYFNYGDAIFTDENGNSIASNKPKEYYHQFSYCRTLSKSWSLGIAVKYIKSDFGTIVYMDSSRHSNYLNSFAVDAGFDYSHSYKISNDKIFNLNIGGSITNFGPKVSYSGDSISTEEFIPATLNLGILVGPEFRMPEDIRINISVAYQAEKLLVPTPPILDNSGNIIKGKDPNISPFKALYQSFYDAPGGFKEEMHEILHKLGGEFRSSYKDLMYFAFRVGRYMEHETKGNRKYSTIGFGIGLYGFTVDYRNVSSSSGLYDNNRIFAIGFKTNLDGKLFRF